jgi:hypothetical protein
VADLVDDGDAVDADGCKNAVSEVFSHQNGSRANTPMLCTTSASALNVLSNWAEYSRHWLCGLSY